MRSNAPVDTRASSKPRKPSRFSDGPPSTIASNNFAAPQGNYLQVAQVLQNGSVQNSNWTLPPTDVPFNLQQFGNPPSIAAPLNEQTIVNPPSTPVPFNVQPFGDPPSATVPFNVQLFANPLHAAPSFNSNISIPYTSSDLPHSSRFSGPPVASANSIPLNSSFTTPLNLSPHLKQNTNVSTTSIEVQNSIPAHAVGAARAVPSLYDPAAIPEVRSTPIPERSQATRVPDPKSASSFSVLHHTPSEATLPRSATSGNTSVAPASTSNANAYTVTPAAVIPTSLSLTLPEKTDADFSSSVSESKVTPHLQADSSLTISNFPRFEYLESESPYIQKLRFATFPPPLQLEPRLIKYSLPKEMLCEYTPTVFEFIPSNAAALPSFLNFNALELLYSPPMTVDLTPPTRPSKQNISLNELDLKLISSVLPNTNIPKQFLKLGTDEKNGHVKEGEVVSKREVAHQGINHEVELIHQKKEASVSQINYLKHPFKKNLKAKRIYNCIPNPKSWQNKYMQVGMEDIYVHSDNNGGNGSDKFLLQPLDTNKLKIRYGLYHHANLEGNHQVPSSFDGNYSFRTSYTTALTDIEMSKSSFLLELPAADDSIINIDEGGIENGTAYISPLFGKKQILTKAESKKMLPLKVKTRFENNSSPIVSSVVPEKPAVQHTSTSEDAILQIYEDPSSNIEPINKLQSTQAIGSLLDVLDPVD